MREGDPSTTESNVDGLEEAVIPEREDGVRGDLGICGKRRLDGGEVMVWVTGGPEGLGYPEGLAEEGDGIEGRWGGALIGHGGEKDGIGGV